MHVSVSALSKDCFNAGLDPPEVGFQTGAPSVEEKCPMCVAVSFSWWKAGVHRAAGYREVRVWLSWDLPLLQEYSQGFCILNDSFYTKF